MIYFFKSKIFESSVDHILKAISNMSRIQQPSRILIKTIIDNLAAENTMFFLLDREKDVFTNISFDGENRSKRFDMIFEIDGRAKIVELIKKDKKIINRKDIKSTIFPFSDNNILLCIPIINKGDPNAILMLGKKKGGGKYTSSDLMLLQKLSDQIAAALESMRMYEEVVSMENYNEEILEALTNGVITTDLDGKISTFNKMATRIIGYSEAEVIGLSCSEIWGPKSTISELVGNSVDGKTFNNFETTLLSKNKTLIPVSLSTTIFKDWTGRRRGVLVVISDLSEVKQLEHRIRQSDKLAALGTMAAGMAHEIKNPLSSMKVLSQLMSKKFEDPEFRAKFIEIMPREIGRIDRIVESLLGFARASTPRLEEIKIVDAIEEALRFLNEQIKDAKITVIKEIEDLPSIVGDIQQLINVFVNLFLNSVQAMPEGGTIRIDAKKHDYNVDGSLKTIYINISDSGHGVPKEYLEKLFDPFFTTKYGGTGLGLTIVHSIIDGHGGTITAESEFGKGTIFRIVLPAVQG